MVIVLKLCMQVVIWDIDWNEGTESIREREREREFHIMQSQPVVPWWNDNEPTVNMKWYSSWNSRFMIFLWTTDHEWNSCSVTDELAVNHCERTCHVIMVYLSQLFVGGWKTKLRDFVDMVDYTDWIEKRRIAEDPQLDRQFSQCVYFVYVKLFYILYYLWSALEQSSYRLYRALYKFCILLLLLFMIQCSE